MHPRAEKRFETDPGLKDQVCPQTILQVGKLEAQGRETPNQGHPELRAEVPARFSPRSGECGFALLEDTVHLGAGAEARVTGQVDGGCVGERVDWLVSPALALYLT